MVTLPPFPVDDQTLNLLSEAIDPDWTVAERSSLNDVCDMYSRLAGSDTSAVEDMVWVPPLADYVPVYADPQYAPSDIITALIEEIRRLRKNENGA